MADTAELLVQALKHHQNGNLSGAEPLYRQILQADPGHVDAHHLLGVLAHQTGHHAAAITLIREAIALQPAAAGFHANLGLVFKKQGQWAQAAECFKQALHLDPQQIVALENLGIAYRNQGNLSEAEHCFRQVLQIQPDSPEGYINLGAVYQDRGQLVEAADYFRQALLLKPNHAIALDNLGITLKDRGQLAEAIECFREVLRLDPKDANAHNNLGVALREMGQYDEAALCHETALGLGSGHHEAHWLHASARWNLSLLKLLKGDFLGAWPDFEYHWQLPGITPPHANRRRWDGTPLQDKTILIYTEQGLGDTLQSIRYAPRVKERVGTVLFACPTILRSLLEGMAGIDRWLAWDEPLPPFDVQAPLLSLPGIFQTTLATIPADVPYLLAKPEQVIRWRGELAEVVGEEKKGLSVGIVWQGNPQNSGDRYRSVPLAHFAPLAHVEGIRLVSLQVGPETDQQKHVSFPVTDWGSRFDKSSLDDLAAALMVLDLVVTVDTAVAHLAGALGVPVWVAVPFAPDWRWLLDRSDSPWYPTMRLFRQRKQGEWQEVFERIAADLAKFTPSLLPAARF